LRGIGAAIAQRLARDGFALAINYASKADEADALVTELKARGDNAIEVRADVSKADEVRRLFDTIEQQLGKVNVLVNNARILRPCPLRTPVMRCSSRPSTSICAASSTHCAMRSAVNSGEQWVKPRVAFHKIAA
jgi:NAD(P)-dependent dehydrogenase (short-subunit alcohol dehydrogenase family)